MLIAEQQFALRQGVQTGERRPETFLPLLMSVRITQCVVGVWAPRPKIGLRGELLNARTCNRQWTHCNARARPLYLKMQSSHYAFSRRSITINVEQREQLKVLAAARLDARFQKLRVLGHVSSLFLSFVRVRSGQRCLRQRQLFSQE